MLFIIIVIIIAVVIIIILAHNVIVNVVVIIIVISNSNWTEWRTIQGVIGHEADLKLRARLLPELYDTKSNY